MNSILEHFKSDPSRFVPASVGEYIGLQIARTLDDLSHLANHVDAAERNWQAAVTNAVNIKRKATS